MKKKNWCKDKFINFFKKLCLRWGTCISIHWGPNGWAPIVSIYIVKFWREHAQFVFSCSCSLPLSCECVDFLVWTCTIFLYSCSGTLPTFYVHIFHELTVWTWTCSYKPSRYNCTRMNKRELSQVWTCTTFIIF